MTEFSPAVCGWCRHPEDSGVYILHVVPELLEEFLALVNKNGLRRDDGARITIEAVARDYHAPGHIDLATTTHWAEDVLD